MNSLLILLTVFRVAFVGDPQVDNATQLDYARASVYKELRERHDLDLVIVLGDLVNDKTELIAPSKASLDSLRCPWIAIPGNHDRDFYRDGSGRPRDLASWKETIGYIDTSFVMSGIRFILMNDVRTKGSADYEAGFSERQKAWLEKLLSATPDNQQVVLATHIPLTEMHARDSLEMLLGGRKKLLLASAHTHQVRREPLSIASFEAESLVAGTSCGSWWRGIKDDFGVPDALMNCGAPRGYFICDFKGDSYRLSYKEVSSDREASAFLNDGKLIVNVFGGSTEGSVRIKVRGKKAMNLPREDMMAEEVRRRIEYNSAMTTEYRRAHREEFIPLLRRSSPHVWAGPAGDLRPGDRVTLLYRDGKMRFRRKITVN